MVSNTVLALHLHENGHRHGDGEEDVGDEHKHLHISLHFHKLLKNSLLSMFFFSPYQITVHIVQCLDPLLLATSGQSAKLRSIISNTFVGEKENPLPSLFGPPSLP